MATIPSVDDSDSSNPPGPKIRVMICDPDPLVRMGIRAVLERFRETEVSGEADDIRRVSTKIHDTDAQAVVLGTPGVEAGVERLRDTVRAGHAAGWSVVMLVASDHPHALAIGAHAGVRHFVDKLALPEELTGALLAACRRTSYLSPTLAHVLLDRVARIPPEDLLGHVDAIVAKLSDREREVLGHLGQGLSNAEIAGHLNIKEPTVRSHVHHILDKLGLPSRSKAVVLGYRYGQAFGQDLSRQALAAGSAS